MLMSLIIFVHGHGITQISMFCSNIIRKISRGSEEASWPHEENVHWTWLNLCLKTLSVVLCFYLLGVREKQSIIV